MTKSKRIILASTSPFRQKILMDAGIIFDAVAPECDEKSIKGLPPRDLASQRASLKALDVAKRCPAGSVIIGADQVLGLGNESFDKASSLDEARHRLTTFQGKTHYLYSAVCIVSMTRTGESLVHDEFVVPIAMTMHKLSEQDISDYLDTNEWQGCVGCYRIEGHGRRLFSNVGGDESAVIGLPLRELLTSLLKLNA